MRIILIMYLIVHIPLSLAAMEPKKAGRFHGDGKDKLIKIIHALSSLEYQALHELANAVYRDRDLDDTNIINYLRDRELVDAHGKIDMSVSAAVKSKYVFHEGQLYKIADGVNDGRKK
jgi:hypothetical protein